METNSYAAPSAPYADAPLHAPITPAAPTVDFTPNDGGGKDIDTDTGTGTVDIVAEALATAKKSVELRALAIKQLREQRAVIDQNLLALGDDIAGTTTQPALNFERPVRASRPAAPAHQHNEPPAADRKRFENIKVADIGRTLLEEKEILSGREIERLARAGGYSSGTANFQNYLPVAFRRAGGFENTGGNTWRLNKSVKPQR